MSRKVTSEGTWCSRGGMKEGLRWVALCTVVFGCTPQTGSEGAVTAAAAPPPAKQEATSASPAGAPHWDRKVRDLFSLEWRDAALRELLRRNHAAGRAEHEQEEQGRIKAVVVCPQPGTEPLIAVFIASPAEKHGSASTSGHFVVFRVDGTFVVFQNWNNFVKGPFGDVDGNGVIENLDPATKTRAGATVETLSVVPMIEPFEPSFILLWPPDSAQWRLREATKSAPPQIELFRQQDDAEVTLAVYRLIDGSWQGPRGSRSEGFLVAGSDLTASVLELAPPQCNGLAEYVAENLPEVRRAYAAAGPDARPGGIYDSDEPGALSMRLGFHHDDAFEARFHVTVSAGELQVTDGYFGQVPIPETEQARVRAACLGRGSLE